jgi:hypothetical protein
MMAVNVEPIRFLVRAIGEEKVSWGCNNIGDYQYLVIPVATCIRSVSPRLKN